MVVLSILCAGLSFANYFWWASTAPTGVLRLASLAGQAVFAAASVVAVLFYRHQRTRASYKRNGVRIFTLGFAVVCIAALASVLVAAVLALHAFGVLVSL